MDLCRINTNNKENSYLCEIIQSEITIEEIGSVTVYGLKLYHRDPDTAKLDGESCTVEDICDDIEPVRHLQKLITELDVSPLHLKDIAEDFVSQSQ